MKIAARSAQWAKLALYSLRRDEDSLVKYGEICPTISAYLNRQSKELELVRLSKIKTETPQPVIAGVNRIALWLGPVSCTSTGTCDVTARNKQGRSSQEMMRRIV